MGQVKKGIYRIYVKRPVDFMLALIALLLLGPLLLITAVLVRAQLGSPVIFAQRRPGLDEKTFTLYKFRTMTNETDEYGMMLPDNARMTRLGRFLRSTSIDELPELFNVLKGDMSLIGPRPQLIRDLVFMTPQQRERHRVLPGVSGWAQVNGRNGITWDEKLALDCVYIRNITFLGDLRILFLTVIKVLRREGIGAHGTDTPDDLGVYLLKQGKISNKEFQTKMELANIYEGVTR